MINVPDDLLKFINTGDKFLVAGHKEPDGDCVGSQIVLCSLLKRMGKEAMPCSAGPFKRKEIKSFESSFCSAPDEKTRKGAKVIIVDCSSLERTGDLAPLLEKLPTALIDHHDPDKNAPNTLDVSYVDPNSPSVTNMIFHLFEALGMKPTREEAELLLFGLCTDTGFFRHTDSSSPETFETAAALIHAGASPKKAYLSMYGGKSLESRYLLGIILSRAESYFGGKLIISTEEYEDTQRYGLEGRDSEVLYQLLQSIAGVIAIVIIRQEKPDNCTVGFRSVDQVDVAAIAQSMGGGGHKYAAGLSINGTIPEIKEKILAAFKKIF
ncbi:MAG: bifunctional oligoribonuclease/PAP phosphatase NrnA [Treponema sp.]|jgi:phosphoesterase RecJ-like protein|nr:bifunctional oligoribonuclease/PAP phosphatase NrnA [Treponema sp.]